MNLALDDVPLPQNLPPKNAWFDSKTSLVVLRSVALPLMNDEAKEVIYLREQRTEMRLKG
jgi:hypothetical protein